MPFKSMAQRRKFHALAKEGKISQKVVDEFEAATKGPLPERAPSQKKKEKSRPNKVWTAKVY